MTVVRNRPALHDRGLWVALCRENELKLLSFLAVQEHARGTPNLVVEKKIHRKVDKNTEKITEIEYARFSALKKFHSIPLNIWCVHMWQTALLALLQFGVFRAASAASVHDGPIFAFVAFDKVGSTSLRQILRTREKLHNHAGVLDDHAAWDTDREDGIAHPICDPIVDQFKGGCQDVDNYASVNIGAHDVRGFHFCTPQGAR